MGLLQRNRTAALPCLQQRSLHGAPPRLLHQPAGRDREAAVWFSRLRPATGAGTPSTAKLNNCGTSLPSTLLLALAGAAALAALAAGDAACQLQSCVDGEELAASALQQRKPALQQAVPASDGCWSVNRGPACRQPAMCCPASTPDSSPFPPPLPSLPPCLQPSWRRLRGTQCWLSAMHC